MLSWESDPLSLNSFSITWALCKGISALLCIPHEVNRFLIATAVRTEFVDVFFGNDVEKMMSLRKTLWDELLKVEGGTGKPPDL